MTEKPNTPPQPGEGGKDSTDLIETVTRGGLSVAYSILDGTIEKRAQQAFETGQALRRSNASQGNAHHKQGELMRAMEAEIEAYIPTAFDRSRLDRLNTDVTQKRTERDAIAKEKREAQMRVIAAEQDCTNSGGVTRAPTRIGIAVVGFLLAALFAAVLTPSLPLVVPGLRDEAGALIPGAQLIAFSIGLGIGITMVWPSFYAALYYIDDFTVRHGSAIAGVLIVIGIGLIRRFQVGEWNAAVVGLVVIETAVVVFVEVISAIMRSRFRDSVSSTKAEQFLAQARRQLEEATEAEKKADASLEGRKELFEQEERRVGLIQALVDKRKYFLNKGNTRVQERFSIGYSTGEG